MISKRIICRFNTSTHKLYFSTKVDAFDLFERRHIGAYSDKDVSDMLTQLGSNSLDDVVKRCIPSKLHHILDKLFPLFATPTETTENNLFNQLVSLGQKNKLYKTYIGHGYHDVIQPSVITRNFLNDPSVYTSYTPYQPEISQGRLELLFNFQTLITELTGLKISNASLLDEASACVEGVSMAFGISKRLRNILVVDKFVNNRSLACIKTRCKVMGIKLKVENVFEYDYEQIGHNLIGVLVQFPDIDGKLIDCTELVDRVHRHGGKAIVSSDLMALTILKSSASMGFDIAVGSTQRFGVEMGYGGPYAAYLACKEEFKRLIPGRIVGVSKDRFDNRALRLALQTREQHIKRQKATSNICTAQALLANICVLYAMYHGPQGLKRIATKMHNLTHILYTCLKQIGFEIENDTFFDTIVVKCDANKITRTAHQFEINFKYIDNGRVGISLNETTQLQDIRDIINVFVKNNNIDIHSYQQKLAEQNVLQIPQKLIRKDKYMQQSIFNNYYSETSIMRYIAYIKSKDVSLTSSMIPLGSCTMKLNASIEMDALSIKNFTKLHPYVDKSQAKGYIQIVEELEDHLAKITGMDNCTIHPISGAQGEYLSLTMIKKYYENKNDIGRTVCLIPSSAHGTNAASASLTQYKIVTLKSDSKTGYLDLHDLKNKIVEYGEKIALIMITYPSTFGIFEPNIIEICDLLHKVGAQVYLDGANMTAQVGLLSPGLLGADICHLNLHKTFCIPHGGGGPGVGPICFKSHLSSFAPKHHEKNMFGCSDISTGQVNGNSYGSASILLISWMYIKLMGYSGLRKSSIHALLSANYMASRLEKHYKILYRNKGNFCAHEFIIDLNMFDHVDIGAIDVAKRLMDYGFHSPTMSFPINNALMIEPTESEGKSELDRYCDALIEIRKEIKEIEDEKYDKTNNLLKNAPHTLNFICNDKWDCKYSRQRAAYPLNYLKANKTWPTVSRLNDSYGDLNLVCSCPPVEQLVD